MPSSSRCRSRRTPRHRGYETGARKVNGRKCHLVVETRGLPLFVMVTPADITDRDAAKEVGLRAAHPALRFADHLGSDHPDGQANHPPKRAASIPRS
ncbi:transposase [Streptomyces sp. PRKS01-29]|nr:transposase [Streptomyces sabulosicollis]